VPGASEGRLDEPRARAAAQLRTAAGAGESKIPQRIQEGRRRAEPPAESPPQPASSYTTAALNASGRRETGRFFRGRGDRRPRPGARAAPSWRAQAAPGGDHRLRLSQHGRPCVRILSGVAGDGDSPERFRDLSPPVVHPARVVTPDQGAAHASALRGRPVDVPGRVVRPAAVTFRLAYRQPRPRLALRTAGLGRANLTPACEGVPLR
jgi:hypothetical protein